MTIISFVQAARRFEPDRHQPRLSQLMPDWLESRRADGRRPRGVASYQQGFARFIVFAQDCRVNELSSEIIQRYKIELAGRCASGTVHLALIRIRAFCVWAMEAGYLTTNPALAVRLPIVTDPDPDPLSRDQITALLAAIDKPAQSYKATWSRNRRAVCLMLYAGLRIGEVAGIERRDIDLDRRTITVRRNVAKGGRSRVIPLCDELATELESIRAYKPAWFVVDQGASRQLRGKAMSLATMAHIFEKWLRRRGMGIHSHQLRKTFATELYLRGEDLATIQRLLGHADPKTTMRYIGASAMKEQEAVNRLTLRAEFGATKNGDSPQ